MDNSSLKNCISDLQLTGMMGFINIHLEEVLETCSTFILLNSTFQDVNPEVTYQIQTLCPRNCSGNGVCNKGNCTCYTGYAGSDCSFDLSGPPEISHISDFGFCDKSKESCDEITIYGKYFIEYMNTLCYMTRLLYDADGKLITTELFQTTLEERTLFEGYCSLQYSNTATWVSFFQFNVSHDGQNFTETFDVYTFQSMCQEYHNDSGKIYYTFKEGFCFIDGLCIPDRATNPEYLCDICNVAINRFRWTYNEGLCLIDGRCIASGERDKSNFCRFCNPASSNTSWSLYEESCFIDNRCYFKRESRQNNKCEICNPDKNQNNWTLNEECITTQHPNTDTSTESTKESTTPVIETRQSAESTTIGQSTDSKWLTSSSTREQMATTASTSSEAEHSTDPLSDTDIIIILCTSGFIIVVVIIIAFVVYHSRMRTKDSKTRWTIPNITSTSKELPGISLMSYTKN
ncbi:von Willebrand factor D and EGF domain-containing protein-like [Saccostrea cucullata]|uniref:von Willebrand factor D and EGF domain-containing protein-like n=1 Tax=Saccostrea cuccullata TaxID=36930 RepID=UPI002ED69621